MTKPAFLVEGEMETLFIKSVCPGSAVRKINCNGDQTTISAIAQRVGSLGRLLHKRYSPLIVIFDRENREESAERIITTICQALDREGIDVPVFVGVPDRNIETWILADYEMFAKAAGLTHARSNTVFEGKNGKAQLKQALGPDCKYVETIHGVEWLKRVRPSVLRAKSPSFSSFATKIEKVGCKWLRS